MISLIKELSDRQVLIKKDDEYFVASQSRPELEPVEVLVFRSDEEGNVKDFLEVDGEVGISLAGFLPKLIERGDFSPGWDVPW